MSDVVPSFVDCQKKTGILNILKSNSANQVLKVLPVFASLKSKVLSLSQSQSSSPFTKIKLTDIIKIDQNLCGSNCFDLTIKTINTKPGILTLCSETLTDMKQWVKSLISFQKCSDAIAGKSDDMSTEKKVLKKKFETIEKTIKKSNKNTEKVKEKYLNKLSEARNFNEKIYRKEMKLKKNVEKKVTKEIEKEREELNKIHQKKEIDLVQKAMDQISELKKSEVDTVKNSIKSRIDELKERSKEEAKKMMDILINESKKLDYSMCFDARLKGFKDLAYKSDVCKKSYADDDQQALCNKEESFCIMCCKSKIGDKFTKDRVKCTTKCNAAVL